MLKNNSNTPRVKSLMSMVIYKIRKKNRGIEIERTEKIAKRFLRKNKYVFLKYWVFALKWKIKNLFILFVNYLWKFIKFLTFPIRLVKNLWSLTDNLDFWNSFHDSNNRSFALDVVKTIISAVGLVATIIAGFGLILTYLDAQQDRKDARENRKLIEERLLTDRFSKAVEQLGKFGKGQEAVRIGAIYALERIAVDSPKDHWTVMEVLTAYIRNNSSLPENINNLNQQEKVKALDNLPRITIDIQSAVTVLRRRKFDNDSDKQFLNLADSNLKGADFRETNLFGAELFRSNLFGANLRKTDLTKARLFEASFRGAFLTEADFTKADLKRANLAGAELALANFTGAYLTRANLTGAFLIGANLTGAYLTRANLTGAVLYLTRYLNIKQLKSAKNWENAIYTDVEWDVYNYKWIPIDKAANEAKIQEIRDSTEGYIQF